MKLIANSFANTTDNQNFVVHILTVTHLASLEMKEPTEHTQELSSWLPYFDDH